VAEVAQVLAFLNSEADECLCWNVVICLINLSNLTAISPKVKKNHLWAVSSIRLRTIR
jgi:hypothetical protein